MAILKRLTGQEKSERLLNYIKRKAHEGSPMHQFMLDTFESFTVKKGARGTKIYTDPKTGKEYNFDEAVKKARQSGILHYVNVRKGQNTDEGMKQHWKDALGHSVTRTQKGQEVEYYKAKKPPKAKGPPLWALGRAGAMTKIIEAVKKPSSNPSSSAGGPLAIHLPDMCPYCGKNMLRYIKKDLLYCDSCTWSGKRSDLSAAPGAAVTAEPPKALPAPPSRSTPRRTGGINMQNMAGKRIKPRVYEVLIFLLIGLFCMFGTPFFGLPQFPYLAVAFMFCIPVYIWLPDEHDVLETVSGGTVSITHGTGIWMIPKSFFKLAAYMLIIAQFFFINQLISTILGFFFYFTLPSRFEKDEPYKLIESIAKMILGAFLAYVIFSTFGGFGNNLAIILGLMTLAFFFNFPVYIEGEHSKNEKTIVISNKLKNATQGEFLNKGFFVILMLVTLFFVTLGPQVLEGSLLWVFLIMWFLSLIVGWSSGPEGRPVMGAMLILISLFLFSTTYTGVIGQAIFGYYWPQVLSFTESLIGPLDGIWSQATAGMGDAWLMMTNPQAYYIQQQQKQQSTKSVVKSGGSRLSMEETRFDVFPSIPGTFEPTEPLIGSVEITNGGEFRSDYLELLVWTSLIDSIVTPPTETHIGSFQRMTCSGTNDASISGSDGTCVWTNIDMTRCRNGETEYCPIYPTEKKLSTFVYTSGWGLAAQNTTTDVNGNDITTYVYAGYTVKVNANLTYAYEVNVSIPMEVIGSNRYVELLENREIELTDLTSEYSGGPVKATIWTPKQPIRTDEPSIVVGSIVNEGSGVVMSADYYIAIPSDFTIGQISSSFRNGGVEGCGPGGYREGLNGGPGWNIVECHHDRQMKPQEFKRVSFFITPVQGARFNANTERDTSLLTGYGYYTYLKTNSQTLVFANGPPQ